MRVLVLWVLFSASRIFAVSSEHQCLSEGSSAVLCSREARMPHLLARGWLSGGKSHSGAAVNLHPELLICTETCCMHCFLFIQVAAGLLIAF